jgi:hypothetical protein
VAANAFVFGDEWHADIRNSADTEATINVPVVMKPAFCISNPCANACGPLMRRWWRLARRGTSPMWMDATRQRASSWGVFQLALSRRPMPPDG